jgi:hypothetical protein
MPAKANICNFFLILIEKAYELKKKVPDKAGEAQALPALLDAQCPGCLHFK